jgi:hypothetical protein
MALRLNDFVVCGEIFNTSYYSVHGWLGLRGRDQIIQLQLTGNCAVDLAGWHFRFEAQGAKEDHRLSPADLTQLSNFAWQQVGPTGLMTVTNDVDAETPSNTVRKMPAVAAPGRLYLEWHSQNGRVVLDLINPKIELLEFNDLAANPAGPPRHRADTDDELFDEDPAYEDGPGEELDTAALGGDAAWDEEDEDHDDEPSWLNEENEEEDPFDLLPDSLKEQFDEAASQTDRALELDQNGIESPCWWADDEDKSDATRELDLIDECLERGEGERLSDLFDGPLRLPRPDQLSTDGEAEPVLKTLLAALARCGVSLAICHHFTPRQAYRLLIEEICVEERAYRELQGTQWVQTFMTSEYCRQCEEEFEREYQEYERRRKERGEGSGDDIPF